MINLFFIEYNNKVNIYKLIKEFIFSAFFEINTLIIGRIISFNSVLIKIKLILSIFKFSKSEI